MPTSRTRLQPLPLLRLQTGAIAHGRRPRHCLLRLLRLCPPRLLRLDPAPRQGVHAAVGNTTKQSLLPPRTMYLLESLILCVHSI
jgi:hypothetical protein